MFRVTKSLFSKLASADAVVVGGGPCGVAVVGSILEQRPQFHQVWADPTFQAGRVGERYREVPSNTKVDLFIQFATALAPFREIVDNSKEPNAITVLKSLPQDEGCKLEFAANMCLMLTDGLVRRFDGIKQHHGKVIAATFDEVLTICCSLLLCGVLLHSGNISLTIIPEHSPLDGHIR